MATIDLTKQRIPYEELIGWLNDNVGQFIMKGDHYSIAIHESMLKTVHRSFGIGWHADFTIFNTDDPATIILTVYDEAQAVMAKIALS